MSSKVTTWLAIEPLDTLMVRDGRGFDAGAASVAVAAAPPPSTVGGVLRQAVEAEIGSHLVGPIVATGVDGPVFAVPQDVVRDEHDELRRLAVGAHQAGERSDLTGRLTHLLVGEGEAVGGFCDADALADWLRGDGELVAGNPVTPEWWRDHGDCRPWQDENRIGLALRQDGELAGTAETGMLYAMAHLRPVDGTHFLVGCVDDAAVRVVEDLVRIGGRGRLATVGEVGAPALPAAPDDFPGGRVSVYLATPALLDDVYWWPQGATLCAIALAGPQPIATASPRGGLWATRRLSWAVPAGTVYYLDFGDSDTAREWAHEHHKGLLPGQPTNLRLVTAGFGTCLTGRW